MRYKVHTVEVFLCIHVVENENGMLSVEKEQVADLSLTMVDQEVASAQVDPSVTAVDQNDSAVHEADQDGVGVGGVQVEINIAQVFTRRFHRAPNQLVAESWMQGQGPWLEVGSVANRTIVAQAAKF
jgi:hypothetical protein